MAGIGFRLSRMLRSEDLLTRISGAIGSIFLSSGPWLATIFSIGVISYIYPTSEDPLSSQIFRITINYTFAFSLFAFSFLELVATRYLADLIYLKQQKIIPTLFAQLGAGTLIFSTVIGIGFYYYSGVHWQVALVATSMLGIVSLIWCAMIFLSACKSFMQISLSFIAGSLTAVTMSYLLGIVFNLKMIGFLTGFAIGQFVIAVSLSYHIFKEFGWVCLEESDFWRRLKSGHILVLVGVLYALSIWVDKVIFWFVKPVSEQVFSVFFKSTTYDTGIFVSYLFIVPAMAFFLVRIETLFYIHYRRFFSFIERRASLKIVEKEHSQILGAVRQTINEIVIFQGVISVAAIIFAPQIIATLKIPLLATIVFRYGVLGATMHVFLLFANILILYMDRPKLVLRNYFLFFILNAIFTLISTQFDIRYHGLGYVLSSFIALLASVVSLRSSLGDMAFHVFMSQPLSSSKDYSLNLDQVDLSSSSSS